MFKIERFFNPDKEKMDTYVTGHAITGDPADVIFSRTKMKNGVEFSLYKSTLSFWDKKTTDFKNFRLDAAGPAADWCAATLTGHVAVIFIIDGEIKTNDEYPKVELFGHVPKLIYRQFLEPGESFEDALPQMIKRLKTAKAPRYERSFSTAVLG